MVQLFLDGGNFMWPILGIGIIGLIFVFERLYHLISGLGANENFALKIADTTKIKVLMMHCQNVMKQLALLLIYVIMHWRALQKE